MQEHQQGLDSDHQCLHTAELIQQEKGLSPFAVQNIVFSFSYLCLQVND